MGERVTEEELRELTHLRESTRHLNGLLVKAENAAAQNAWDAMRARGVVRALKRGDCWCEKAVGNPMVKEHTPECWRAQELLDG